MTKSGDNQFARIKYLENLIERWCEYYVDGMSSDDVQELYVDSLLSTDAPCKDIKVQEPDTTSYDITLRTYWVEVLLDDGATHGVPVDGYQDDLDRVKQDAMDNAKEWGLRPVEIDSITEEES